MKLKDIKGIGPKTEELFAKLGIYTPEDLLRYYPVGYDEYKLPVSIGEAHVGEKCAVKGVLARNVVLRRTKKVTILTTEISDPTGSLQLTWFNAPFLAKMLKRGSVFIFRGQISERHGRRVMDHPEIFTLARYDELAETLVPVYSLTKGLSGKTIAKAVRAVVKSDISSLNEYLPESLIRLLGLTDESRALMSIHFPESASDFEKARKRLVFDEFFLFVLAVRLLKARDEDAVNAYPMTKNWDTEELIERLPFPLTGAQRRVWREIETDLAGDKLMSRLVQGDVGSGKTVIAFLSMAMAASNGYQSAMMAPTEVLARQHFEKLTALKEEQGLDYLHPCILTGSSKTGERRDILEGLESGRYNAVIGTHALFQDTVRYQNLSLVVTDEQHRFGVRQRQAMTEKGDPPNVLVMSATPIPRTLGVIFYGDLDISVIDELPAKRKPIKNAVVDESYRDASLRFIGKQAAEGRQIYVICPMIEPSEELPLHNVLEETAAMKKEFPDLTVGMLHGRMKAEEKNDVMERFLAGEIQILVSTTVIEVGVDVPNATVMLIQNAERFGLAQLHQLRGRVGRGEHQSYCVFSAGQSSPEITERLNILKKSTDGFVIAEKDFEMRGPGDLLGIRQSGDARFRLADVTKDGAILKMAGETAASIMTDDPAMIMDEHQLLKREITAYIRANERNIVL